VCERQELAEAITVLESVTAFRALRRGNERLRATYIATHRAHADRLVEGALSDESGFGETRGLPTYLLDTVFAPRGKTSSTWVLTTEPIHAAGIAGGFGNTVVIR
jgi:hypothetical protein